MCRKEEHCGDRLGKDRRGRLRWENVDEKGQKE
jgi:hypothetical protein